MDQQNIDRFFREKLDGLEVNPSSQAWSQVEKRIRPKKSLTFYWVAASVSLLIVSWIVWPKESNLESQFILSEVDHPLTPGTFDLAARVAAELDVPIKPKVEVIKKEEFVEAVKPLQQVQVAKTDEPLSQDNIIVLDEIVTEKAVAIEDSTTPRLEEIVNLDEEIDIERVTKESPKTFKITYIASSQKIKDTQVQESDSTGVFKKFIAFAGKIDPGEMLADMKTAKDNLINGGLKNKKERSAMIP